MKITLIITETEIEIKKAIAEAWNKRYGEKLTYRDIGRVDNREDILQAIPYLDFNNSKGNIEIIVNDKD